MFLPECPFYVGVDWAAETHAVCVLDGTGKIAAEFTIAHTTNAFAELLTRLGRLAPDRGEVPVGIERPDGRLVDALLEAGHPVVPVSPNAIKTWREDEVLSGAKSDPGDAAVIAEYLRLRAHRLRPMTPFTAPTIALRTVVRTRTDIVELRVAATNQLTALLDAHWPGATAIFADVESRRSRRSGVRLLAMVQADQRRRSRSIVSVPMAFPQDIAIPICCESCRGHKV